MFKKCLKLFILFFSILSFSGKKKILVLTSSGGGGHSSAVEAIKNSLGSGYQIDVVNALTDIFDQAEILRSVLGVTAEDLYNYSLISGLINFINKIVKVGSYYFYYSYGNMVKNFESFISDKNYDLIISVMPIINDTVFYVCKNRNIPFLLVPVDLNLKFYFLNSISYYKKFFINLFYNDEIAKKYIPNGVRRSQIINLGTPLRPSFFQKNIDKEKIKKEFDIPEGKDIAMIFMGASGAKKAFFYVKQIAQQYKKDIHLIVCMGHNTKIKNKLDNLQLPKNVSLSKVGFTHKIPDLMNIADVIITKSGPSSVFESIASRRPMIIDATGEVIDWEKASLKFVRQKDIGIVLDDIKDLSNSLDSILSDNNFRNKLIKNIKKINLGNFNRNFRRLVGKLA